MSDNAEAGVEPTQPTRDKGLAIRLDLLKPFASDPGQRLTFSDVQAAFGTDLHTTQKIVRVLRDAQLLSSSAPASGNRPVYTLDKALVKLLAGPAPGRIARAKALECVSQVLEAVAAHNAGSTRARVVGVELAGQLLDASAATLNFVDVQAAVAVSSSRLLVQDMAALLRRLRKVGNGVVRPALVFVVE